MFYYKFLIDTAVALKSKGRISRTVIFSKGELLTENELRVWMHRAKRSESFCPLQGCEYSCRKVIKIGKRRFEP